MIENGKNLTLTVDGVAVTAGMSTVLGRILLAYMPPTPFRYKPGDTIDIAGVNHLVLESGHSPYIPKMVSLVIQEKANG